MGCGTSCEIKPQFDSKILGTEKEDMEKASFMLKQLGSPSKLKLLFRASQHNFEAAAFHKNCDNIPNTVTIVRTESNRTIAAFTPLKWEGSKNRKQVADPSRSSFLLQLELREKMTLIQGREQYAIGNYCNCGPCFGGEVGYDLCIADKCDQNNRSHAYFPTSYNCGSKYLRNEQTWTLFSGATDWNRFRVIEYEVFEVLK